MSDQQLSNLIKMLEQIVANNLHHGEDEQVAEVAADHLNSFWARSMKQQIIHFTQNNPAQLSTAARLSVIRLAEKNNSKQTE